MSRGTLRVYLGAAAGVGKTFAMLGEGHRRRERGTDVVVAFVEDHGRQHTAEQVVGLEVVPRRRIGHRGTTFEEMDLDAVLARHPEVALVDELAHTNVPGCRHAKRWQDVHTLLDAGIDVITTVNIQHLESLNDVVEAITGVRQHETVPDHVVRAAEQIELVDMTPQALRRRMAHGNVYAPEKVDAALASYFRVGNLTALRELALLWLADRVDDALEQYRADHDIHEPWPARERVVVALSGGPEGDALVRRGARVVARASGGELLALHVTRSDGLTGAGPDDLARQRGLVESLGGTWHTVVGDDVARSVVEFARGVNATQVVLGAPRRNRLRAFVDPGPGPGVVRESGDIDVRIVRLDEGHGTSEGGREPRLPVSRRRLGWLLATLGTAALAGLLHATRDLHGLPTVLMLFLAWTVAVALVGGTGPAVAAAVLGGLLANVLFTPPLYTVTVARPENALAIAVLVGVAVAVSVVVDRSARRSVEAARARAEADTLSVLAGSVLRGEEALPLLLDRLRESLALDRVAIVTRDGDGTWTEAGATSPPSGEAPVTLVPVSQDVALRLEGRPLRADEARIARVVAAQVEAVRERDRLRAEAAGARAERERTAIRTALLAAVSHDLRTPLAGIKAGVSSLRSASVALTAADRAALLAEVDGSADRLRALIDNLLDMSRLDAGAVRPLLDAVALDEVLPAAAAGIPAERLRLDVPETLPLVVADEGLLERALGNALENAVRFAPPGAPVLVRADDLGTEVAVRVVDRGPGVRDEDKAEIFRAFQRLGDAPSGQGVGLGLAVARGFVEACGGTVEAEDTPGGGLTLVVTLPVADRDEPAATDGAERADVRPAGAAGAPRPDDGDDAGHAGDADDADDAEVLR
jgi:two-component system sensor histidine kinase KdpD